MIGLAVVAAAIAVYETLRERFTASVFTGPMRTSVLDRSRTTRRTRRQPPSP